MPKRRKKANNDHNAKDPAPAAQSRQGKRLGGTNMTGDGRAGAKQQKSGDEYDVEYVLACIFYLLLLNVIG
jgi:hypothetical protein